MIPLTNHHFQSGRSEVVIIYPDGSIVFDAFEQVFDGFEIQFGCGSKWKTDVGPQMLV